ncbi:hypothetical protein LCGC14_2335330, partial [marine sediment metagenome]
MRGAGAGNGTGASRLLIGLRGAVERLDRVSRIVVIAAMAVMTGLVVSQVVARYAFSSALDWSEEVARLAFVWTMFLAIPHGIRHGVHVGIDALVVKLPARTQAMLFRVTAVFGAVLMAAVFWFGLQVTVSTWPELMPTLPVTAAVYYVAILISAGHSLLHLVVLG